MAIVDNYEPLSNGVTRNVDSSFNASPQTQVLQSAGSLKTAVGNISSVIKNSADVVNGVASSITEAGLLGLNIESAFNNTDQYEQVANAAGKAFENYFNSKMNRIRDLWNTKVDVTFQSIIGEVAPYALKVERIGPRIDKKIVKMLGFVLGTGSNDGDYRSLLNDLGQDVLDNLQADSSLNESVSQLSVIQAYANAFNLVSQTIAIIKKIKTIYETIKPILEISKDLALTYWSCGTSAMSASNTMVEEVEKSVSVLETLLFFAIKKLVFPLKIKLPALIVGAVDTISVRSAMLSLPEEYDWLSMLFNEDFWNDLEYTMSMSDSISSALSAVSKAKNSVQANYAMWQEMANQANNPDRAGLERGDLMKKLFMEEFTKGYMRNISANARKMAYIPDYSSISYFRKDSGSNQYSKDSSSAITPVQASVWKHQRNDNSQENPIKNMNSLMKISKILYDNI